MAVKWHKVARGLQGTIHESRKHGRRFDRYIRGRYQVDGKIQVVGFGWESEWGAAERARMQAEGQKGPRRSFVEYCQGELARLKQNALKGAGPFTLKEDRRLAEAKAREEKKTSLKADRENMSFGQFFKETYWPVAKSSKKRDSFRKEMEHFNKGINPVVGELPFKEISQIQVEKIKRNMQKAQRSWRCIED
ncbi:MAG: hypothetical protein K9M96_06385 [Deltaproteobacteria bacterium]|nr:hypothetical protein [Deltaproteobacteria bacterium]